MMNGESNSKKRKNGEASNQAKVSRKKISHHGSTSQDDSTGRILLLENQILESRKNYNNIVDLIKICQDEKTQENEILAAVVSLCRVFARFLVGGNMVKSKDAPHNEVVIVDWLKDRYKEYQTFLLRSLGNGSPEKQVQNNIHTAKIQADIK